MLPSASVAVGRSNQTMGFRHYHWLAGWIRSFDLPFCICPAETSRSIDYTTTCSATTINIRQCWSPVLSGRIDICGKMELLCIRVADGTTFQISFYIPFYFQVVQGVGPIAAGIRLIPLMLPQMVALLVAGAVVTTFGYYVGLISKAYQVTWMLIFI